MISGHRRLACARLLELADLPCEVRTIDGEDDRRRAVLEYNRQRRKTFSQIDARGRRPRNRSWATRPEAGATPTSDEGRTADLADRRNSDDRDGRTDSAVAAAIGLGGKDLYRQARAIWQVAQDGDPRARSGVDQLDAGTKTIHAAYKDLRRRDRFTTGFRPTPYDVWAFKHDRAFGIPHPGSIPPGIVAHTLHYFTEPGALVVDPMAGGGTTLDVCESMGRRCLAYDIDPVRPDVHPPRRTRSAFRPKPADATWSSATRPIIPCWPGATPGTGSPTRRSPPGSLSWTHFARDAFAALRPGGRLALLLANQTEKDLPAGHGYIDHAFLGYNALIARGLPARAPDQLPDGRGLSPAARPPGPARRADAGPGPRPASSPANPCR